MPTLAEAAAAPLRVGTNLKTPPTCSHLAQKTIGYRLSDWTRGRKALVKDITATTASDAIQSVQSVALSAGQKHTLVSSIVTHT